MDDHSTTKKKENAEKVSLRQWIAQNGPAGWDEVLSLLLPAMEDAKALHQSGFLSLSVSPDTIEVDGEAKGHLIPSDGYRLSEVSDPETEADFEIQKGYSAPELILRDSILGKWTDVYSLAAVFLYCLTGTDPEDAAGRIPGRKLSLSGKAAGLSLDQESSLEKALSVSPQARFQSVDALIQAFSSHRSGRHSLGSAILYGVLTIAVVLYFRFANTESPKKASPKPQPNAEEQIVIPTVFPDRQEEMPVSLSVGGDHIAVVYEDGTLRTAGENAHGELGDGSTSRRSSLVQTAENVIAADTAWQITAVLKEDHSLWMAGSNDAGQFGSGTGEGSSDFIRVMDGVKQVSTGWKATAVIKEDDTLWSFGYNDSGQLGNGSTQDQPSPVLIMEDVRSVSAGWKELAIVKNDGSLYTCGRNDCGQLGDGTTQDYAEPQKIMDDVAMASVGWKELAILKNDGTLYTCGRNDCGQLGDGTTQDRMTPVLIMEDVKSVSAGFKELAILKNDGTLYTCGLNDFGQLGTGSKSDHYSPVMVMDHVTGCAVGTDARVLLAYREDGTLFTSGQGEKGSLGNGTTKDALKLTLLTNEK